MLIEHISEYAADDKKMLRDEVREILKVNGTVVLEGDWYHDKISARIDGYLKALKDQKIAYRLTTSKVYTEDY